MISFHWQFEAAGLSTGLVLVMEDERMVDIIFNIGSKNSTSTMIVSLWQQVKLLQGLIPTTLQVKLTFQFYTLHLCHGKIVVSTRGACW